MVEKTKYVERPLPKISLANFDSRIDEITAQLVDAAENVGFFAIVDHGITQAEQDAVFGASQSFFSLPDEIKSTVPWNPQNVGYENRSQVRPSTGAPDSKESYQLQFGENMVAPSGKSLWVDDEHVPGFRETCQTFMRRVQSVGEKLMLCFARGLGFPDDYFVQFHDATNPKAQSVLRLLHYYATPESAAAEGKIYHRAGAHADWGFLTLLFQREGQSGLEICPGREVVTKFAVGDTWTKVPFESGAIVCNIGDLLMSWSDDRFKSTYHRVKAPCEPGDYFGERYSIAFFNQPRKDALIQGPKKKYPLVTGEQFIAEAMATHFAALQAKLKSQSSGGGPSSPKENGHVATPSVQAAA
ncbi:leucoanthocyanidin dioxygenase [Coniochaeta ligniaria NRRL 30616]|uniref:Leucoanthocyanidin dioxygenase n=1 Tax=Coniochaeta ligniaria NRRL 30616 TaxID=1408157 RepID=A0A1J7JRK5_9PEZI|nr:leucoanthocyanidin dioxygenase [Coniochaeta ligniaria NRRL 30616]